MTAHVSRLVTTTLATGSLGILLTLLSITATGSHQLRWDGSFCTIGGCAVTSHAAMKARTQAGLSARTL
jgi:hypothetical protein